MLNIIFKSKAAKRRAGGQNTSGPNWLGGPKSWKTSDHGCDCQKGLGLVMCNHLFVLGPDPGSRQPCLEAAD